MCPPVCCHDLATIEGCVDLRFECALRMRGQCRAAANDTQFKTVEQSNMNPRASVLARYMRRQHPIVQCKLISEHTVAFAMASCYATTQNHPTLSHPLRSDTPRMHHNESKRSVELQRMVAELWNICLTHVA